MSIAIRVARGLALAAAAALMVPAGVLAVPPEHSPTVPVDVELPAGDVCEHAVVLSNPTYRLHDTAYAPLPDGSTRFFSRGMASSRATDVQTGATVDSRGGSALVFRFAADGSIAVQGTGLIFAWYVPGDDSDLGPGLWLVNGRVTETYGPDGTFIRATFSGHALDVCAALGA